MALFDGLFNDLTFSDALGAGALALGAYSMFRGDSDTDKAYRGVLDEQARLTRALSDPNDPYFRQLEAQERDKARREFTDQLNQIAVKARRQSARTGGMGLIDPERRDEFLSSAMLRGEAQVNDLARERAREFLRSALGANSGLGQSYAAASQGANASRNRWLGGAEIALRGADKLFGNKTFGDIFGGSNRLLDGGNGPGRSMVSVYDTEPLPGWRA